MSFLSPYSFLDTPSLIIDRDAALRNIAAMQKKADELKVNLRPHIKTHRMAYFAMEQMAAGACGIAAAKLAEAEVMADAGIPDIFIANEIVGIGKYERLRALHRRVKIRTGVDCREQIDQIERVFEGEKPLEVLMEYEVGENRSGVITDEQLTDLVSYTLTKKNVRLRGIFSHEGQSYSAATPEECRRSSEESYLRTLAAADKMRALGVDVDTVSVGATPSVMSGAFMKGVTELRLGTYIFMDLGQAHAIGDFSRCAATVLATVISRPTAERVVLDTGAKALVSQNRTGGICASDGFGCVKGRESVKVEKLFDEHGLIYDRAFRDEVRVGDKVEIIPSHICPTVNLYDEAQLVSQGRLLEVIPVSCRGCSQ